MHKRPWAGGKGRSQAGRAGSAVSAGTESQVDTRVSWRGLSAAGLSLLFSVTMGNNLCPPPCLVLLVLVLSSGGKQGTPHLPFVPSICLNFPGGWGAAGLHQPFLRRREHDSSACSPVPDRLPSGWSRDQRRLLPASPGWPGPGVPVPLWLLPIPCTDPNLQSHRLLERPADSRPKGRQEGGVQRLGAWEQWAAGAGQVGAAQGLVTAWLAG